MDPMTDEEQQAREDVGGSAYVELHAILNGHLKRAPESVRLLIAVEVLANLTSNTLTAGFTGTPETFRHTMKLLGDYVRALRHNVDQHIKEPLPEHPAGTPKPPFPGTTH